MYDGDMSKAPFLGPDRRRDDPLTDAAEIAECRRLAGQERDPDPLILVWQEIGWDPELMRWDGPATTEES